MDRDTNFSIFIVDDSKLDRAILESVLSKAFHVESFATPDQCLVRLNEAAALPNLILLDVDMPVLDGYTLCRQIKADQGLQKIPVIFVSGRDDLESRMEGFDAGGTDFLHKPVNLKELRQKIETARRVSAERQLLNNKVLESETLASLVLSNLDEYALLIQFLRSLNECDSARALSDRFFELLRAYGLHSAIQVRLPALETTLSDCGETSPIEVDVIRHLRGMDRIFEFRRRAAYNFEHITVLIKNMPLHDPEQCGRLRDHLAIAAEAADAKLKTLQTRSENTQARSAVTDSLEALTLIVSEFEGKYARARYQSSSLSLDMLNELASAFAFLGMSDQQEHQILNIVKGKVESLAEIYDFSSETQAALNTVTGKLAGILQPAAVGTAADTPTRPTSPGRGESTAAIELF